MAKKGQKRGLKRSKATKFWKIARKEKKWTINTHPGRHNKEALPLAFILRDYLGYAHTLREARRILSERKVKINGKVRTDFKFPVGIMDVVEIPLTKQYYRVLLNGKGVLILHSIKEEEKNFRPLKVIGKHVVKKGKTQLSFHDGTTFLTEEAYKTLGTVVYNFESKSVQEYFPLTEGSIALVTGGRNVSRTGKITSIHENKVEIEGKEEPFRTLRENVFVIGSKKSVISIPGD